MNYVVAFLFNEDRSQVALIRKIKPDWQRDFLNGIGGKIEAWEDEHEAVRREFAEEAGPAEGEPGYRVIEWRKFCVLSFRGGLIHFFEAAADDIAIDTKTAEEVGWYAVADLSILPVLPNLRWLIPMALDKDRVVARVEDLS